MSEALVPSSHEFNKVGDCGRYSSLIEVKAMKKYGVEPDIPDR